MRRLQIVAHDTSKVAYIRAWLLGLDHDLYDVVNAHLWKIVVLKPNERVEKHSPHLASIPTADPSRNRAAGLFVPHEAAIYLRMVDGLVLGHELGHVIDLVLGVNGYLSEQDPRFRTAHDGAQKFISHRAASPDLAEAFAENFRAMLGAHAHSPDHFYPEASAEILREYDPAWFALMEWVLKTAIPARAAEIRTRGEGRTHRSPRTTPPARRTA